ncbi:hypothetical protein ES703_105677 [subsurface metagenome]
MARAVVVFRQPPLGYGHTHPITEALAQRPGGYLHTRGQPVLRVTRGLAVPLAEIFDFLKRKVIAGKVEKGIEHGRSVARRKDKAVPVGPFWVFGVVL